MKTGRQILIFLIFVVGCILLLSLVFGGNKNSSSKSSKKVFDLVKYAKLDSEVVVIKDGQINGDDQHQAVRITVDQHTRKIDIIRGYEGKVIASKSYANNLKAYTEFMNALAKVNYGKTRKTNLASEQGVCASGRRYVFEVLDQGDSVSRTWTADCQKGNSPADPSVVYNLFRRQITDYDTITEDVSL